MKCTQDRRTAQLRRLPMFADVRGSRLAEATRDGDLATIPTGKVVVREGRIGNQFCVVIAGEADVERGGRKVATLGRGSFFGEMSLLTGAPTNATVTATTPMTVLAFHPRAFRSLLHHSPSVRDQIVAAASARAATQR